MMRVIGTAGHVDHGKSTLVQALTGVHPDRLKEEQAREMTIDLGFAYLTLPNGEEVGIVDVPGHRDFIENMLSGVGGIDAVLFVVAADEGVMPQTREHLAILDLLQVQGGVVALTKTDLVDDPEWLFLVEEELREVLAGTVLGDAPIVPVSAKTGIGVSDLLVAITTCLDERPPRPDLKRPRLPIDRVFTMAGFGTVVTGTLTDGALAVGQEVVVLPGGAAGRIRGLQSHGRKEKMATPGSRTAVNISGVSLEAVQRGEWVVTPQQYRATRRVDLQFRQLPDVIQPIKHNMEVKFFVGAAEVLGRLRLLGTDNLPPGETGWIQLELREPVVAMRGDRYILRRPSPGETLGGGMVVDAHPRGRHKRFQPNLLARLAALAQGTPEDVFYQAVVRLGIASLYQVIKTAGLPTEQTEAVVADLLTKQQIVLLDDIETPTRNTLLTTRTHWDALAEQIVGAVGAYHQENSLRLGIPREELKSRLKLATPIFNVVIEKLARAEAIMVEGALVWLPAHEIVFTPAQAAQVRQLLAQFAESPYSPPTVKRAQAAVGTDVYAALVDLGQLIPVSADVVYRTEDYTQLRAETVAMMQGAGVMTLAEFRDRFQTSRKYALAFLEHLDAVGVTVRDGEGRRLVSVSLGD